jgi:hypothetical protein
VFSIDNSLEVFLTESLDRSVLSAIAMGSNPAVKNAIKAENNKKTPGVFITE